METNVFPLPFYNHLIFCIVSTLFFIFQFYRLKHKYQLLTIVAIDATLLLYVSDNQVFFYGIGIFELLMLIGIAIVMNLERKKR